MRGGVGGDTLASARSGVFAGAMGSTSERGLGLGLSGDLFLFLFDDRFK